MSLVRPEESISWELRGAWIQQKRVALSLDERCRWPRIEGQVQRVAATGTSVTIDGWHIPMDAVLAVHFPSRLGDSTIDQPKVKPVPVCIACDREVEIDRRTGACAHCLAELGLVAA